MKFKVGDKVKIICVDTKTGSSGTEAKIGHIGMVHKFSNIPSMPYTIYFKPDGFKINFMEKELEKYNEVGKQLLFSFMSD